MKQLFVLLFLAFGFAATAQKKPAKPSANSKVPQMPKLSAAELKEMQDALKELEAEDPEAAKELKKVIDQLQGLNSTAPPTTTAAYKPPKFSNPKVRITLTQPVKIPTKEESTDRMLWFTGKKINPTTIVNPNGYVMQYRRKEKIVVVQPADPRKDPFEKVVKALENYEKTKDKYLKKLDNDPNIFFFYPVIEGGISETDWAAEEFRKLANNTVDLGKQISDEEDGDQPNDFPKSEAKVPDSTMRRYHEVLKLVKDHPPLEFPDPPAMELDNCTACDSVKSAQHRASLSEWHLAFSEYEGKLHRKATIVLRDLDTLKSAEATKMRTDMDMAIEMSIGRFKNKVQLLESKFGKDFRYVQSIIIENVALARQLLLVGINADGEEAAIFSKLIRYMNEYDKYVLDFIKQKNFAGAMNIHKLIAISREKQFMGEFNEESNYPEMIVALNNFNRFKLSMHIEFAIAGDGLKATGTLETPDDVYVSLAPDGCKFQLRNTYGKYVDQEEFKYYLPLTATSGRKDQEEENEIWRSYAHSGPKDIVNSFPVIRLSFCDEGSDSMYLSIFRYKLDDFVNHKGAFPKAYTIDFVGYLNMLVLNPDGAESSVAGGMHIIGDMVRINNLSVASTGHPLLRKWERDYEKLKQMRDANIRFTQLQVSRKAIITFDANKTGNVLFSGEGDFSGGGGTYQVTKGIVRVRVVHAPITE